MNSDIKITRLPNNINPDVLIRKTMKEKYAVCPYCGNKDYKDCIDNFIFKEEKEKGIISIGIEEWYGYPDGKYGTDWNGLIYSIKHRKELMNWKKYIYCCYKCGCRWESKSFPDKVLTKKETCDIGNLLNEKRLDI